MSNSSYQTLILKISDLNTARGMKLGLENMQRLDSLMGYPSKAFQSIHVAGTNGKGSVTLKIAKGLQSKHSKVGIFTSPHISSFRERIAINGVMISEESAEEILSSILSVAERNQIPATFFELTTLLAFVYFSRKKVDAAVIETGLGGRFDATNIIHPILSVITSIDFDHTEFLGTTLDAIAQEKAGIIKPGIPVVLGPTADLARSPPQSPRLYVRGPFENVEAENRAIAKKALESLYVEESAIKKALTAKPPCRREIVLFQEQEVLLDVSHNPRGLFCLFKELNFLKKDVRVVFAISKTKDINSCLNILHSFCACIHLTQAANGRSAPIQQLYTNLKKQGVSEERLAVHASVTEALSAAIPLSRQFKQKLIVCGTFFIMQEARQFLGFNDPVDFFDMNEK